MRRLNAGWHQLQCYGLADFDSANTEAREIFARQQKQERMAFVTTALDVMTTAINQRKSIGKHETHEMDGGKHGRDSEASSQAGNLDGNPDSTWAASSWQGSCT